MHSRFAPVLAIPCIKSITIDTLSHFSVERKETKQKAVIRMSADNYAASIRTKRNNSFTARNSTFQCHGASLLVTVLQLAMALSCLVNFRLFHLNQASTWNIARFSPPSPPFFSFFNTDWRASQESKSRNGTASTLPILPKTIRRRPLSAIINGTHIISNPQGLLDFAVIGFGKMRHYVHCTMAGHPSGNSMSQVRSVQTN